MEDVQNLRAFSALGQNCFGRTKNLKTDELDKILKADAEREKKKSMNLQKDCA